MNILGISAFYHDSAACLLRDGRVAAAAQEERFSRKKHDESFPSQSIQYCLSSQHLTIQDIDYVAFYEKPFIKFERLLESYLAYAPSGFFSFILAMPQWIKKKLWIKEIIREELNYAGPVLFPEHHESHAASAFFPSPFERAAFLTVDGVGEWATAAFGSGQGNALKTLKELHFPHSLGLLYSAFTYYTGFKVNSGEYKMMGLAPYGEPKYTDVILAKLIDLKQDGSFRLNMNYFDYAAGLTMTNERFDRLFGEPPRHPESEIRQKDCDLARSIQDVTEEIILRMARFACEQTGEENLVLAGGVALNCTANERLRKEGPFKNIWIQPAAGDAGGALGAALCVWHQYLNKPRAADGRHDAQQASLLGPAYSDDEIKRILDEEMADYQQLEEQQIPAAVTELINNQKIVGWFQGRMEYGPRALGARSILADARSPHMQSVLNKKIKRREEFRPFAPSILESRAGEYFEIKTPSPYMLLTVPVSARHRRELTLEERKCTGLAQLDIKRSDIPAVTHVDYSARVQTVSKTDHPRFYQLLKYFDQHYGCPLVVNTSFNVRGEPIVQNPREAYDCFMRTDMDCLMIGSFLVTKNRERVRFRRAGEKKAYALD